jgi:hypothetical protein
MVFKILYSLVKKYRKFKSDIKCFIFDKHSYKINEPDYFNVVKYQTFIRYICTNCNKVSYKKNKLRRY